MHFCRIIPCVLLCLTIISCRTQQAQLFSSDLRPGDLLFHITNQNNAITEVTPGMVDHVAIYLGGDSILEAIGCGVVITPFDSLSKRSGYQLIGRVKRVDAKRSITNALNYVGRPYDWLYLPDNEAIYCSELVQLSYVDHQGKQLFSTIPMSFHDNSGQITDYWTAFYAKHQMDVPEGKPGTNPGEMSRHPTVDIIGRLRL